MLSIPLRVVGLIAVAVVLSSASAQRSWAADSSDPWPDLVRDVFAGRHLTDGTGLIAIDMPARAEDAGIVPVTLSATIPPGDERIPVAFTLVIDMNPAPVAATFKVGPGVTTISTRVRVNDYTNVHAVAELSDGQALCRQHIRKGFGWMFRADGQESRSSVGEPRPNALSTIRWIEYGLRSANHDPPSEQFRTATQPDHQPPYSAVHRARTASLAGRSASAANGRRHFNFGGSKLSILVPA